MPTFFCAAQKSGLPVLGHIKNHQTGRLTSQLSQQHPLFAQRLGELGKRLPAPAFVRCHREYVVNLNRVRSIIPRNTRDYDLRLDPPVNRRIPIARDRLEQIRKILGV
jgi:DNA-binding LytR/AlgR family response regulator